VLNHADAPLLCAAAIWRAWQLKNHIKFMLTAGLPFRVETIGNGYGSLMPETAQLTGIDDNPQRSTLYAVLSHRIATAEAGGLFNFAHFPDVFTAVFGHGNIG
jgi:hypothetical protein